MVTFEVERECDVFLGVGARGRELMRFFGMTVDGLRRRAVRHRLSLRLEAGQVCWIGGPSGAGKSLLLDALYEQTPVDERISLASIGLERDASVIDCVDGPLREVLDALCRAGLSDVPCLLRPPALLSEGQQWRYRLARALMSRRRYIFADEFCASLDTTTALAVAYQIRRVADKTGRAFVLAGCREDVLVELRPEVLVATGRGGAEVIYRSQEPEVIRQKGG